MTNDVINKVLYDVDQRADTTEQEKKTARDNIGAAASNEITSKSEIKVYEGNHTVHKNLMTIYADGGRGSCATVTFNNENSNVALVKRPATGDNGKVLVAKEQTGLGPWFEWEILQIPSYTAGNGISINNNQISWAYSVGRNLHLNQNNQIQTNLPGGLFTAPTATSTSFTTLTGADFASAFKLACRHNLNNTYELGLSYTASGYSAPITFIGTETIIPVGGGITVYPAFYLNDQIYNTPHRFGRDDSTAFNPTLHKAIIYNGIGNIGTCCDLKMAIWSDNSSVKIAFTAIEVGKVGSNL